MKQGRINHLEYVNADEEENIIEDKNKMIKQNDPFEMRLKSIANDKSNSKKIMIMV